MDKRRGGIYGFCIGDAMGVPAEFNSREALRINPIMNMQPCEKPNLPAGTWSDDSSMMLCLMDSLAEGLDYDDMMIKYYRWFSYGEYTPCGFCFDIGNTTRKAIYDFARGKPALECGGAAEWDNGNGSLMRCLPLALYLQSIKDEEKRMQIIHNVSSVTHAHKRSHIACSIYTVLAMELIRGKSREEAMSAVNRCFRYYKNKPEYKSELGHFRAVEGLSDFVLRDENYISSTGYVVSTLEAALWCFYNTHSYRACVLRAINLGDDADTVAALAGGLAGIYYGYESIPAEWAEALQGKAIIDRISSKFFNAVDKLENR